MHRHRRRPRRRRHPRGRRRAARSGPSCSPTATTTTSTSPIELPSATGAPVHLHPRGPRRLGAEPGRCARRHPRPTGRSSTSVTSTSGSCTRRVTRRAAAPSTRSALHVVFTGDTLFQGGPGATGRSFSSFEQIIESIRDAAPHPALGHRRPHRPRRRDDDRRRGAAPRRVDRPRSLTYPDAVGRLGIVRACQSRGSGGRAAGTLVRVTLRLFDSQSRALRDFVPLQPGRVGIYICGLTTQAPPHIGHVRFAVAFDVLRAGSCAATGSTCARPQRHRPRRQDPAQVRRVGRGLVRPVLPQRGRDRRGAAPARCPAADLRAPRHGTHHRDGRAHRAAHRQRPCVCRRGRLG